MPPASTTTQPPAQRARSSPRPPSSSSSSPPRNRPPAARARQGGRDLVSGRSPLTRRRSNWSVIVAVEYVACMVMIGLSAGLVGKKGKTGTEQDLASPAIAMVRLSAVSLLFFALAIASAGERAGRLAAAFGGLVTCGVALNATNEWKALSKVFAPPKKAASSRPSSSQTSSAVPRPGISPVSFNSAPTGTWE